ncbi:hypothetical protein V5O48_011784 [Marasmius crinis-equi]|uniref:Major facilitator superfamily (MFS) profile domain-containing protein n=1 Tax=Marasmius crinis-equi TaxID=585013 RepID=A0ABR3F504_9AGAR
MTESIKLEAIHPNNDPKGSSVRHVVHQKSTSSLAERNGAPLPEVQEDARPVANLDSSFTQTKSQTIKAHVQMMVLSWTMFLVGWNDGTTGPLLPKMQEVYHTSDTIVSLVFIFACVGFVSGACLNVIISDKLGFGKVLVLGSTLQIIAYAIQSAAPPFPAFVLGYTINGVGIALQDAQANSFAASLLKNTEAKMGLLHAIYGLGAFGAPLVATQFSQLDRWSFYYLISLGMALINTALLVTVFRFKTQDYCLEQIGQPVVQDANGAPSQASFKTILGQRSVHLMAFFLLVYVGIEVTIGGWIVTFIIRERHGGTDAGYISSGFFGGLALGRVALLWFNSLVGERYATFIYAALAIGLEFIVWFVPSLVGGAVAVSIVGFFLGPIYPITMNHAGRVLPRWLLAGAIGWIAGFGQAGSAVFPFMTGALAGKFGIESLQPLLIAMMVAMTILWGVINVAGRRRKD